jgi:hypothetical protein
VLIGYFGSAFSKVDLAPPFSKVDFQRWILKGGFLKAGPILNQIRFGCHLHNEILSPL